MSRPALLLCPGRGSYTASELGYLTRPLADERRAALETAIDRVDQGRAARGDATIRAMDGADSFSSDFLRGENASGLTFACTALDFLRLDGDAVDVVAVGGNSMGWYSALFAGGALDLDDTFTLIETMGAATRDGAIGAQLIYPLVDEQWHVDAERRQHVQQALSAVTSAGAQAGWSIRYGGYAVLWADQAGLGVLLSALPETNVGSRKYPLTIPGHSAFHSSLMTAVSRDGLEALAGLAWRPPVRPLIDGRGAQWRPLGCDPTALYRYTLDTQVTETFDFSATV
ncbi:MAG: ACP S-malonyltransferase, partial [Acidobacteriota bacterium]